MSTNKSSITEEHKGSSLLVWCVNGTLCVFIFFGIRGEVIQIICMREERETAADALEM